MNAKNIFMVKWYNHCQSKYWYNSFLASSEFCGPRSVGDWLVHSLLQLSERWPCHVWIVGRMKFASLVSILVGVVAFLVYPILFLLLTHDWSIVDWNFKPKNNIINEPISGQTELWSTIWHSYNKCSLKNILKKGQQSQQQNHETKIPSMQRQD